MTPCGEESFPSIYFNNFDENLKSKYISKFYANCEATGKHFNLPAGHSKSGMGVTVLEKIHSIYSYLDSDILSL